MMATVVLASAVLLIPVRAQAARFTLDDLQVVLQGGVVGFGGTLSREPFDPELLFLDGLEVSIAGLLPDTTPFFFSWPVSITTSFGPALMFTVEAHAALAPGIYSGSATVIASDGAGTPVEIQAQDFWVTVREHTQSIPDLGSSLLLLGIGLAGLRAVRKRWQ
jgi:hypothetical protein